MSNVNFGMTYEAEPAKLVTENKSIVGIMPYGPNALKQALDFLSRTRDKYPFDKILSRSYPL